MLAFAATDALGQSSLWIRPLNSSEAQKMDQTERALLPFCSPDSQFIGFCAGGKLTREQWLAARLELLKAEKELTRRSDDLARQRQELPWVRVDKECRFDTTRGARR
jgi:hypothetical protein